MTYLDTGCFVKLYYPEPDSQKVIGLIQGRQVCYTPLHEMEFVNALHLKVFFQSATKSQVSASRSSVEADLQAGVLVSTGGEWPAIFQEAIHLAEQNTDSLGCRSLDVLHCAAAKVLKATEFISTDARQRKLALAMGINLITF